MSQATVGLGISVFFSSNRMCTCCGHPEGPYTSLTPFKVFLQRACGWKNSRTRRRKSFSQSELCIILVFWVKYCIIFFSPRLHTDGFWVTSESRETSQKTWGVKSLESYYLCCIRILSFPLTLTGTQDNFGDKILIVEPEKYKAKWQEWGKGNTLSSPDWNRFF